MTNDVTPSKIVFIVIVACITSYKMSLSDATCNMLDVTFVFTNNNHER